MVFQCGLLTLHPILTNNTSTTRVIMRYATTQISQLMQVRVMKQWELLTVTIQISQLMQARTIEQ